MATSGSMTVTETTNEVPKPPKTYRLILRMSWKRFKDYFQSKDVVDSQKKMREERKAILHKIDNGEPISEAEREMLNSSFKQTLLTLFQNLQTFLLNYLQLEESDNPQLQSFKLLAAHDVTLWLKNLDVHISKTLEDIIDRSLPGKEMISKAQKVLNELKNELKPENFSEFLSLPATPGEICSGDLGGDEASLNSTAGKRTSLDSPGTDENTILNQQSSTTSRTTEESTIPNPQSSTTKESTQTKQSDEDEGIWEYIFGDWFLI